MYLKTTLATLAVTTLVANAASVANYSAGVSPTAGTTGASDPTTQSWTAIGGVTGFSHGLDSTIGGWRITDGTSSQPYFYQHTISGADAGLMASNDWTATWTTAVNADAVQNTGVPNGVDNFYAAGGAGSQNNNAMWVELAGGAWYVLTFNVDGNNDIQINDGTNTFQITTANNQLSEELGTGAPFANYITFTLSSVGGVASLTDSLGGNHGAVAAFGTGGIDRVVFGAFSGSGFGSTTWNNIDVDVVPEPSSALLLGLASLALLRRRR